MLHYCILVYSQFDDDTPYILDLENKENAVNIARSLMEIALSKTEKINGIDVYEVHEKENRSEMVFSVSF